MCKWQNVKLGDVIELVYGKGLPENKRKKGQVPVYGSNGIVGCHNESCFIAPNIIIGRKGTVGALHFSDIDFWAIDTTYTIKFKQNIYNIYFWYYLLKTLGLENMNSHSAVPGLNRDTVYHIPILLPPLEQQQYIASTLSAFDDKIEINKRICSGLEDMARLLFRREFIDNEGSVGWEKVTLGFYAKVYSGYAFKGKEFIDEGCPVIKIKNISDNGLNINDLQCVEYPTKLENTTYHLKDKDIIIAMTGATIGKYTMFYEFSNIPTLLNQRVAKISRNIPCWNFVYTSLSFGFIDFIVNRASGSAQANISTSEIENFPMLCIPQKLLEKFENTVAPMYQKIEMLQKEIINLRATRDLLLPRLMKGDI